MSGVVLSPKYGVNPSITTCFWCGEATGIALMGRINPSKKRGKYAEDLEAPKYCFGGYDPCPKCKENMALGTALMEMEQEPQFDNQPEIQKGLYPTGRFLVMKREVAKEMFNIDSPRIYIDRGIMNQLLEQIE